MEESVILNEYEYNSYLKEILIFSAYNRHIRDENKSGIKHPHRPLLSFQWWSNI